MMVNDDLLGGKTLYIATGIGCSQGFPLQGLPQLADAQSRRCILELLHDHAGRTTRVCKLCSNWRIPVACQRLGQFTYVANSCHSSTSMLGFARSLQIRRR